MTQYVVKRPNTHAWLSRESKQALALAAFAGVFLAASGAFDTEVAAPMPRLTYWMLISFVTTAALEGGHRLLRWRFPKVADLRLRFWGGAALVLPLTLLALLICKIVFGGYPRTEHFVALLPGMVGISVALQVVLAYSPTPASEKDRPPGQPNPLISALPIRFRSARIDALQAEDHYVRVYTSAGQALVRMRMRDAVEALDSPEGLRPHRSWWVSQQSVIALRKRGGGAILTIVGGQQVPVSRAFARSLGPEFCTREVQD